VPEILSGVATADGYTDACALLPDKNTQQVTFVGVGADYLVRVYIKQVDALASAPVWDGVERYYPAGTGDSFGAQCGGVFFRSAVAGSPATVYGQQAFVGDVLSAAPAYGGGPSPFESLLTTDGVTSVKPTGELLIGAGLTLTSPGTGIAELVAAASPAITEITSVDGSVVVTDPTGPIVNLRVPVAGNPADARHYGYLTFQVFRPGVPFDLIVANQVCTIVGTKANGVTIGNLYTVQFTVTVNAGDYLSLFYQNQSGAVRNVQMNNGRVQDAGGNIEDVQAGSAPQNVANNNGIALDFAHGSGTSTPPPNAVLLNYATPTKPFFIAGGTYNVQMLFYASFWV
jgi:hypothetical protein